MLSENKRKKRRKKEKKSWEKDKYQTKCNLIEKQKELEDIEKEIYELIKAPWIYIKTKLVVYAI